jgi:hypothetical protein
MWSASMLIAALSPRRAADAAMASWRTRNIVVGGLRLTITGFATVALYAATGEDLALTVRLASGLLLSPFLFFWSETRPGPEWPSEASRHTANMRLEGRGPAGRWELHPDLIREEAREFAN